MSPWSHGGAGWARRPLAALAAGAIRSLGATWRTTVTGAPPPRSPFVLLTWHEGLLVAAFALRDRGLFVPLSLSRDGDLAEQVLRRLGFAPSPRGSSSRGASALLRAMVRRVRAGESGGILPDGPRGPAFVVKPGVVALAAATGAPVVPVGIAAWPVKRARSWDRALIPTPFARVHLHYGEPVEIPRRAGDAQLEAWVEQLTEALHRAARSSQLALASPG